MFVRIAGVRTIGRGSVGVSGVGVEVVVVVERDGGFEGYERVG
jgi:hypothetical protein